MKEIDADFFKNDAIASQHGPKMRVKEIWQKSKPLMSIFGSRLLRRVL